MWKDYSIGFIKRNRASSIAVLTASLISSLFLSLLCGLFYNLRHYEAEAVVLEAENRQGAAAEAFAQDAASKIETVPAPSLLTFFYLLVLLLVSASLILIIRHSFAVSMNARIHQFGVFSSIGATPRQIRSCLLQEAVMLCALPVLLGSLSGIALTFGVIQAVNALAEGIAGRREAVFSYHPLVFAATILAAALTVLISAWMPAWKLSKMTPLEAIKNAGEWQLTRKKESRILAFFFGAEGELAGNALKAQRKSLRTAALSLTLSFLGFTLMLCFFTLSGISTNHTYFERYQNSWDVMAALKNTALEEFTDTEKLHAMPGTDSVIYQKASALCAVPADAVSGEVKALGGLAKIAGGKISAADGFYTIPAPVVIMDDSSFLKYCRQIGVSSAENGSVILNRIWDNKNSNFRYKKYVPFLSEGRRQIRLMNRENTAAAVTLPVLALTQEPPVLREEYENYALVQFVSLSTWKQLQKTIGGAEPDTYLRVLSKKERTPEAVNAIEREVTNVLGHSVAFQMENRFQEKLDNDAMVNGYQLMLGALCALLAFIGIASVFSNTLGFLRQRKREFARYLSVGMTPEGMRKMLCIEALVIAGRPVLITLPITALFVWLMITASYLNPMEFWAAAPVVPIALFVLAIFAFVALAYYFGGKQILNCNLMEALQGDEMV